MWSRIEAALEAEEQSFSRGGARRAAQRTGSSPQSDIRGSARGADRHWSVTLRRRGARDRFARLHSHRPTPISTEDYLTSRWIAEPANLLDNDIPIHTAAAYLFTTADRAQNLRQAGQEAEAQKLFRQLAEGTWQPRFQPLQREARRQLERR